MVRRIKSITTAAATLAAAALLPHQADAAGFALKEQSAVAQGASYAGAAARADDPSTMFYNAAGITKLGGYQVSLGASNIFPDGTLASGSATTGALLGGRPVAGTIGTNSGVNAVLPNLTATAQLTDTLFVGLGITSPFGLATKYPTNSIARYYALTTDLKTVNIAPTIAWQVIPELSIGGGINIETANAHLSNSVDFGSIGALSGLGRFGLVPGSADGIATVKGRDTAVGWNVGLLYEPIPGTRIGVSYRSAMFHQLDGAIIYSGVPTLLTRSFQNQNATAKVPEPSTASVSVAQTLGDFTLLGDVTYTGWSIFQNLQAYTGTTLASTTTEKFRDTVSVSFGADYKVNDQFTLRAGTMYDPTPVQKQYRTPRIADSDRYWLSGGVTYRPIPKLALTAAYSHLFAHDASVNLVDAGPGTPNFTKGNLSATYNVSVDIFSVQASYRF